MQTDINQIYTLTMAFHKLLNEIFDVVLKKFPNDRDIGYTKSQIDITTNISPGLVVSTFIQEITPYLDQIKNRDEEFFLRKSRTDETISYMNLADKWKSFSDKEKDKLWNNVDKMLKLADKILI